MIAWLDTGQIALRYDWRDCGKENAPAAVLIHEVGGILENWDRVIAHLGAAVHVLRYDLRGHGLSEKRSAPPSLSLLRDDVLALIAHCAPNAKLIVAGAAVGGAVAAEVARACGARMAGLVLLSPSFGIPDARKPAIDALAARIEAEGMRATVDEQFARSYPPELRTDFEDFTAFRARVIGTDPAAYAAFYRMLNRMRPEDLTATLDCPAHVLAGSLDGARPPSLLKPLAAQLGAKFSEIPGGHFLHWQAPEAASAAILEHAR